MPNDTRDIDAVALLHDPVRRRLYDWLATRGDPVSRDEAAAGVGISRALAAFHLDRLVAEGLLVAEYRRLSGRTGPGAGRPAKLYRRAARDIAVSLPERRYEIAARVMADAFERAGDVPPTAVVASARATGLEIGAAARIAAGGRPGIAAGGRPGIAAGGKPGVAAVGRPGKRRRREALVVALRDRGYEPSAAAAGDITLRNCPFDALVDDHRQLICGMNLALAQGVLDGLGEADIVARLDPQPDRCCVVMGDATGS